MLTGRSLRTAWARGRMGPLLWAVEQALPRMGTPSRKQTLGLRGVTPLLLQVWVYFFKACLCAEATETT